MKIKSLLLGILIVSLFFTNFPIGTSYNKSVKFNEEFSESVVRLMKIPQKLFRLSPKPTGPQRLRRDKRDKKTRQKKPDASAFGSVLNLTRNQLQQPATKSLHQVQF